MYEVRTLDLSAAQLGEGSELVPRAQRIAEIFALDVPSGNSFQIKFGGGPWMTIPRGFTMEPQGDEGNAGLRWRNPVAQAGVAIELVIVYGSAQLDTVLS